MRDWLVIEDGDDLVEMTADFADLLRAIHRALPRWPGLQSRIYSEWHALRSRRLK